MARSSRIGAFLLLLASVAAGCSENASRDAVSPDGPAFASTGPVLIECPVNQATSATGVLGALGGLVRLHGHQLDVPRLALTNPQGFRLEAPVSGYMELSVRAGGHDSFQFRKTATITIDYSRCTRDNIDHYPLSVWQIDPETKELIEFMGGVDDKVSRTVTFQTDHLSTFSIAR